MSFWAVESKYRDKGHEVICGVDEAGRGPLAGPVVAAAVVLPFGTDIPGLDDSKKLSESARDRMYDLIIEKAVSYSIASASHTEVDELNILQATYLAMNRAIEELLIKMGESRYICLIDGNRNEGIKHNSVPIVGGDGKSVSIAAASILAKVSRDRYMLEMSKEYPMYGFEKHKGYGTELHYERLLEYGPCQIHRTTFLKKLRV